MIINNDSLEVLRTCHYNYNDTLKSLVSDNLYLSIVATNACQRRCPYCINSLEDKSLDLPIDKAKENIKKAIDILGVKEAVILGGEPTLYPKLFELIEFLKESGLRKFGLTTNGIRIKDAVRERCDFFEELIKTGIDFINISFHNDKEGLTFRDLYHIRRCFNENKRSHQKLRINTNVWKGNHDNVHDLAVFINLISSYCDEIRISNLIRKNTFSVNPTQVQEAETMYMTDSEYEDLFRQFIEENKSRYTIIHNPSALGFVNYYLIPSPVPVIINWNIVSKVSEQVCENNIGENKIHTIKCLVTSDLSLSWNLNNKIVL